jgi:phage baseplate assembly protein V
MSFDRLANAMRAQSQRSLQSVRALRGGIVTSYDPESYSARVSLQPDNVETGWLPVWSPWANEAWGLVCPPSPGAQVAVIFFEGDPDAGAVFGGLYSNADPAPKMPADEDGEPRDGEAGEFFLVHKSGSCLAFRNDGTVLVRADTTMQIDAPQGLKINANGGVQINAVDGGVEISGDITHYGNQETTGDHIDSTANGNSTNLRTFRQKYNEHLHIGVMPGGGVSGISNKPTV